MISAETPLARTTRSMPYQSVAGDMVAARTSLIGQLGADRFDLHMSVQFFAMPRSHSAFDRVWRYRCQRFVRMSTSGTAIWFLSRVYVTKPVTASP